jgi:hypothetical protein
MLEENDSWVATRQIYIQEQYNLAYSPKIKPTWKPSVSGSSIKDLRFLVPLLLLLLQHQDFGKSYSLRSHNPTCIWVTTSWPILTSTGVVIALNGSRCLAYASDI